MRRAGEGSMHAPYRAPGTRPVELRPLDPAEEWRLLAEATSRPRWPQMVFITAYAFFGVGMLLLMALDGKLAPVDWALGLPALYVMSPAITAVVGWRRYRRHRRRLEAEGYDLSGANEVIGLANARGAARRSGSRSARPSSTSP
jgi:hypothetical protein